MTDEGFEHKFDKQQRFVEDLFRQFNAGEIDFATLQAKVARRTLDQPMAENFLFLCINAMIGNEPTAPLGFISHLMLMRILRLEDDVRKLRAEVAKDRITLTKYGTGERSNDGTTIE